MPVKGYFNIDVYSCKIHIYIADSIMKPINNIMKEDNDSINYEPAGFTVRPNDKIANYYLFFSTNHVDSNTVNHEKSHVVDWILQDRSIKANGEQRAYLDGLVSEKLNKLFKRRKIKVK